MIYIEKNTNNLIALELSQTLPTCAASCSYLFEFKWEETPEDRTRYFTTADISPATNRYNLFTLSESISGSIGNIVSASINLDPGQYMYNVYWTGSNIVNIPNMLTTASISTGRMVVAGTASVIYDSVTPTPTSSVYL